MRRTQIRYHGKMEREREREKKRISNSGTKHILLFMVNFDWVTIDIRIKVI